MFQEPSDENLHFPLRSLASLQRSSKALLDLEAELTGASRQRGPVCTRQGAAGPHGNSLVETSAAGAGGRVAGGALAKGAPGPTWDSLLKSASGAGGRGSLAKGAAAPTLDSLSKSVEGAETLTSAFSEDGSQPSLSRLNNMLGSMNDIQNSLDEILVSLGKATARMSRPTQSHQGGPLADA
eukprot:gene2188-33731_t